MDANQSYGELHDILCDVVHEAGQDGTTKAPQMQPRNESHWVRGRGVRLERRRRPVEPSKIGINIVIMARILPDAIQDCTYQSFNDTNKFEDIVEKLQTWFGNRNRVPMDIGEEVKSSDDSTSYTEEPEIDMVGIDRHLIVPSGNILNVALPRCVGP